MINGTEASWRPVTSSILQRSILGAVLLNILNDLDDRAEFTLSSFANDTKLRGVTHGHATIQRDPNRLEKWTHRNFRNLNQERCNT